MIITYLQFAERLARGQLKNTNAVENTNLGEISPDYVASILSLTNEGLVDLTTRLPLIKRLVDLTFVTDQFSYALVNGSDWLSVIGLDPFVDDDFVKVLDIFNSFGRRYQPNTNGHITTPTHNVLRFSADYRDPTKTGIYIGPTVRIQYQAKHAVIVVDDNIDLPPNLFPALQLYVAGHYISDMGGKENSNRGDEYFALYLRHTVEDVVANVSGTSEIDEITRFEDSGFV